MENTHDFWKTVLAKKSRYYAGTVGQHLDALAIMQYAIRGAKKQDDIFELEKYRRIVIYIAKKMRKGGFGVNFAQSLSYVEKMQDYRYTRQTYDRIQNESIKASKGEKYDSKLLYSFALSSSEYETQETQAMADDNARQWAYAIINSIGSTTRARYRAQVRKYGIEKLATLYMDNKKLYNSLRKCIHRIHGKTDISVYDSFYLFFKYL